MKLQRSLRLITAALTLATIGLPAGNGAAAEKSAINPTGTWKVTYTPKPQSGFEPTLKLKLEGDKLTGTLSRPRAKAMTLEEAKLKGSEISFTTHMVPTLGDQTVTSNSKYQGTISGDTIKGKVEDEWMGHTRTREWQAKRVKE